MDFVALDVETANGDLSSICQIGLVQFRGGVAEHRHSFLVNPRDPFDPINISIHGITASDVVGAPSFAELSSNLCGLLAGQIVVHHTAFDPAAVLRASLKCSREPPTCHWLDSAKVTRRAWERYARSGYGLENVARDLGIQFKHHDAVEDAYCAGMIVLRAISETGVPLAEWLSRVSRKPSYVDSRPKRNGNPDGLLSGEVVAFTGALTMPRKEAADMAAAAGCKVGSSVTTETTILVVGDQDLRRLNGKEKSAKQLKAEKFIKDGQQLRIIGESDFAAMVGSAAPALVRRSRSSARRALDEQQRPEDAPEKEKFAGRWITRDDLDRLSQIEALDEDSGETHLIRTHPTSTDAVEGRVISFAYADAAGERTRRILLCWHCWFDGAIYVRGFCLLRQAIRTFRTDRMRDTHDARTGELFDADDFFGVRAALASPGDAVTVETHVEPGKTYGNASGAADVLRFKTVIETRVSDKITRREAPISVALPNIKTASMRETKSTRRGRKGTIWAAALALIGLGVGGSLLAFSDQAQRRQAFLQDAQSSFAVARPDIQLSIPAEDGRMLQLSSMKMTAPDAEALVRSMPASVREVGFQSVLFTNGRERWQWDVRSAEMQPLR